MMVISLSPRSLFCNIPLMIILRRYSDSSKYCQDANTSSHNCVLSTHCSLIGYFFSCFQPKISTPSNCTFLSSQSFHNVVDLYLLSSFQIVLILGLSSARYYLWNLISASLLRNQKLQFSIQVQIADKLYIHTGISYSCPNLKFTKSSQSRPFHIWNCQFVLGNEYIETLKLNCNLYHWSILLNL